MEITTETTRCIPLFDDETTICTVGQWIHEQWGHLNPGQTLETRITKVRDCLGPTRLPLMQVAMQNNRPVGCASLVDSDMHTRPNYHPWLASVYVDDACRGHGVGSLVVEATVQQGIDLGYQTLYLFTKDRQLFYQRMGWKPIEKSQYRGETVTVMKLNIAS